VAVELTLGLREGTKLTFKTTPDETPPSSDVNFINIFEPLFVEFKGRDDPDW